MTPLEEQLAEALKEVTQVLEASLAFGFHDHEVGEGSPKDKSDKALAEYDRQKKLEKPKAHY